MARPPERTILENNLYVHSDFLQTNFRPLYWLELLHHFPKKK